MSAERPSAARDVWPVVVRRSVFLGDLTQVHVEWGDRELVIRKTGLDMLPDGQPAFLSIDQRCYVLLEAG
jgi:hypothetical protein